MVGDYGLPYGQYAVPIESVLVLLRREANRPEYNGQVEIERKRPDGSWMRSVIQYTVIRVWERPFEQFLTAGPSLLPLAVLGKGVTKAKVPGILDRIGERLAVEAKEKQAGDCWLATEILSGLAFPADLIHNWFRGRTTMGLEGSVIYQEILAKGEVKGEAKGIRKSIEIVGRDMLGKPNARAMIELEDIQDIERLQRLLGVLAQVKSWGELLDIP